MPFALATSWNPEVIRDIKKQQNAAKEKTLNAYSRDNLHHSSSVVYQTPEKMAKMNYGN
jgi:hypothetical protein